MDFGNANATSFVRAACDYAGPLGAGGVYFVDKSTHPITASYMASSGEWLHDGGDGLHCVGRLLLEESSSSSVNFVNAVGTIFTAWRADELDPGIVDVAVESHAPIEVNTSAVEIDGLPAVPLAEVSTPRRHLVGRVNEWTERVVADTAAALTRNPIPSDMDLSLVAEGPSTEELLVVTLEGGFRPLLSSADGAVAAAAALVECGYTGVDHEFLVRAQGGPVTVSLKRIDGRLVATTMGNATFIYTATVDPDDIVYQHELLLDIDANVSEIIAFGRRASANGLKLPDLGLSFDP